MDEALKSYRFNAQGQGIKDVLDRSLNEVFTILRQLQNREASIAIRNLEQVGMWGTKAISRVPHLVIAEAVELEKKA